MGTHVAVSVRVAVKVDVGVGVEVSVGVTVGLGVTVEPEGLTTKEGMKRRVVNRSVGSVGRKIVAQGNVGSKVTS